ncbi:36833_t:CDS:2, partial [Racocetra persica]
IDRLLAVILNTNNLKELIAFPKNIDGTYALIKQKDEQIGGKITKDLIDKLEAVSKLDLKKQAKKDKDGNDLKDSQGNIIYEEIVDLSPLKTLLEELKTKGVSADLSSTNNKIDEVKTKVEGIKSGGIAVLLLGYVAFLKPAPDINVYEEKAKKEEIESNNSLKDKVLPETKEQNSTEPYYYSFIRLKGQNIDLPVIFKIKDEQENLTELSLKKGLFLELT